MKYYAIKNKKTGDLLKYDCSVVCYGDGEGGDKVYTLSESKYNCIWLIEKKDIAEKALDTDTPYYNAGYKTPSHPNNFNKEDYEVVEVEFVVKERKEI